MLVQLSDRTIRTWRKRLKNKPEGTTQGCCVLFWTNPGSSASISQTIQIRRTCHILMVKQEEVISYVFLGTPTHEDTSVDWSAKIIFIRSVRSLDAVKRTYPERWPMETDWLTDGNLCYQHVLIMMMMMIFPFRYVQLNILQFVTWRKILKHLSPVKSITWYSYKNCHLIRWMIFDNF